jgi:nitrogen fixation NifU-like protein
LREALTDADRSAMLEELARGRFGSGLDGAPAGPEARLRSPSCGDEFTVRLELADDVITSLHWDGHGCVVSTAAAAVLAQLAGGVATAEFPVAAVRYLASVQLDGVPVPELGDAEIFAGIGRFPLRAGCASLAWRAALAALAAA